VSWYRKAAEQGHASAQFDLGVMYANGQGIPQNYAAGSRTWASMLWQSVDKRA
jgi:TPR repeat protein